MRAVSNGSSEKDSKVRPASGVRTMHTVGPSSTCTFLDRASAASRSPSWRTRWGFHAEPMAAPQGTDTDRRPIRLSPRTPDGPSDTLSAGMPRRSTAGRYHMLAPAVSEVFSSRVMAPTRRSISLSISVWAGVSMSISISKVISPGVDEGSTTTGGPGRSLCPSGRPRRVEGVHEAPPGHGRVDDFVDLEVLGHVDRLPVLVGAGNHGVEGGGPLTGVVDEVEFPPEAEAHRPLEAHAAELAGPPSHGEQWPAEAAAGHGLRAQPVRLAQDHAGEGHGQRGSDHEHPADMAYQRCLFRRS